MFFLAEIIFTLLLASSVSGHGYVAEVIIDGTSYPGNVPGAANPISSAIRQISDIGPVKGSTNPSLNCGLNANSSASLVATANPGSQMQINWRGGGTNTWPHNTGPLMTYLASCGSTTCDKFDSTTAKWFKIDQVARSSSTGAWVQATISTGGFYDFSLPAKLAPGNYLMRHEIIALQNGVAVGGAEFYPACMQMKVGGSQTGAPTSSELVSFPGAYNDNDPGIFDPNVYDPSSSYTFPGPNIAAFVGASSGSSSGSGSTSSSGSNSGSSNTGSPSSGTSTGTSSGISSTSSTNPITTPTSTNSAGSSGATQQCRLQRRPSSASSAVPPFSSDALVRPRHFSRVMKDLLFHGTH